MSTMHEMPEGLRPLAAGYAPELVGIDAQMTALGKPHLPYTAIFNPKALAAHRAALEAWERDNPEAAIRWAELDAEYAAVEERLESAKWSDDAWRFELMARMGFPSGAVELCRKELRETDMFRAAREWMLGGTQWCVVLTGGPGCGKTVAATWAAHQLLSRRFRPFWVSCPRVSESNFYDTAGEHHRWKAREALALVLDDLGEGRREQESKPWNAWLDDVLTERHAKRRKTIITTNRKPAELVAWLGARLVDRLNEGSIVGTNAASMRGKS